ncbi:hypothetical protein Vretimale_8920 [Volvox reticuliferus]|uniref:Uncharacterized protein n=1 Tax=Volvox reticuliferus TaxID=1737510 RepID=A0A8J4CR64_9CHLO|nr:hypothetical protein Vretifemale_14418 [Volvox reticuliferus]GIM04374.1 hypothetical protein Vretimale_8920 [Volvox reticuliferus]
MFNEMFLYCINEYMFFSLVLETQAGPGPSLRVCAHTFRTFAPFEGFHVVFARLWRSRRGPPVQDAVARLAVQPGLVEEVVGSTVLCGEAPCLVISSVQGSQYISS